MTTAPYHPWLHRFAVLTAVVALLPIVVGALVTTKDAGMAFHDWPSSDGQNMFLYPWFSSAGDKFLEHGHRLAGALIGLFSIGLVVFVRRVESRRFVRVTAWLILAAVILQGLIGGFRVLADQRLLALFHGSFAALVFSLICAVGLFTSRGWLMGNDQQNDRDVGVGILKPLAVVTTLIIFGQYLVGGLLRHLGTALFEHVGLAVVVSLFVLATAISALCQQDVRLRPPALMLLAILLLQLSLGAGAWVSRFGLASLGYVAVQHSPLQILLRTSHTVVGMLLLMTAVLLTLRVLRFDALRHRRIADFEEPIRLVGTLPVKGGVR